MKAFMMNYLFLMEVLKKLYLMMKKRLFMYTRHMVNDLKFIKVHEK